MLSVKERGLLRSIIKHCNKIKEKTIGLTKEKLEKDEDVLEIICFNILQIGELAKHFEPSFLSKYNKMPWKEIKGMRDYVAHGYGSINKNRVWNTATKDITPLLEYCLQILKED